MISGNVAGRYASAVQPDPVLAQLHRQRRGGERQHEADQEQSDAADHHGREHDERNQHQHAEVLRVPATGQGQAATSDDRGDDQADRRGYPAVDARDGDDVHVRRRDTRGGQGDGTDPSTGAAVQPCGHCHQCDGQSPARRDPELWTQKARLGGEHEQKHDADQGDRHSGNGEQLPDPTLVARRLRHDGLRRRHGLLRRSLRRWRRILRLILRPVRHRVRLRNRLGYRRLLGQQAVQRGQVRRDPRHVLRYGGEIGGQPGDESAVRFGHGQHRGSGGTVSG